MFCFVGICKMWNFLVKSFISILFSQKKINNYNISQKALEEYFWTSTMTSLNFWNDIVVLTNDWSLRLSAMLPNSSILLIHAYIQTCVFDLESILLLHSNVTIHFDLTVFISTAFGVISIWLYSTQKYLIYRHNFP